jgi:phosphonate transport system ATP-binding protein
MLASLQFNDNEPRHMAYAVETRELTKSFANCLALDKVSIKISEGEMVALLGASGSGKSTLLRHLPGFVTSNSGEIDVFDQTVQSNGKLMPSFKKVRSRIGFVFQQFNLVNRLPVITNVLIGQLYETPWWRSLFMRFTTEQRQTALEALASVGIEQAAWQRASTLSGGQQQRAALARCLVQKAKIILADEPIASLDPESSRKVMDLLQQMNKVQKCTVLVSLHQVEFAIRYCPRTIALNAGRVVYDGPSSALTPQLLAELYGSSVSELFKSQEATASLDTILATPFGNIAPV